jgi:hypothetical protein
LNHLHRVSADKRSIHTLRVNVTLEECRYLDVLVPLCMKE